jgi:hypothetical protein
VRTLRIGIRRTALEARLYWQFWGQSDRSDFFELSALGDEQVFDFPTAAAR